MFEKFKDTLDKSVAAVSVKSESLVESSRTKTAINNTQKKMDAELSALGGKVFKAWQAEQFSMELITEDLNRIQALENEVAALKTRLEQIKEEEGRILGTQQKAAPAAGGGFCSNCGKALIAGSRFCDECGTPVNQG